MQLEIGMKVLHPLYPHWGEGTVVNFVEHDPIVQFEDRSGPPAPFCLENLQDQDGHSLARLIPKPPTKAQIRAELKARVEAARVAKEEAAAAEQQESIRQAVNYLIPIIDQLRLQAPVVGKESEGEEFEIFYRQHTGDEIDVIVRPGRWGGSWCIEVPFTPDSVLPFPIVQFMSAGWRGPRQKAQPLAMLLKDGCSFRLCNTQVTLRLIEKGLRFKTT